MGPACPPLCVSPSHVTDYMHNIHVHVHAHVTCVHVRARHVRPTDRASAPHTTSEGHLFAARTCACTRREYMDMYMDMDKKPPRGRAVFMRRACAPTPPPRWPAAHSARRSAAHAANAPRAAPSHTSRARSPPTRAPTPPLFYDPSHVDKFPAPKALIPT